MSSYNVTTKHKVGAYMIDEFDNISRSEMLAGYMTENNATVRKTARIYGISKSTVHKDVTEKLKLVNYELYIKTKELLEKNKAERHIRGGEATRKKYLELKK